MEKGIVKCSFADICYGLGYFRLNRLYVEYGEFINRKDNTILRLLSWFFCRIFAVLGF